METIGRTRQYHKRMGIEVKRDIDLSNPALNNHRIQVIGNELFTLKRCLEMEDVCGSLECLMNLYIELNSTMLLLGMAAYKGEAFNAVHNANMTKLDDNGRPVIEDDGQIAQTSNYENPDMQEVITTVKEGGL